MKIPTNIMAVGIDPAKQVHQGVATTYPEVIFLAVGLRIVMRLFPPLMRK